jgi:hypothetical protein
MAKERKATGRVEKCQGVALNAPFGALLQSLKWIIDKDIFAHLTKHGNTNWTFGELVVLGVLWVWSDKHTLTGAFEHAAQLAVNMFDSVALTTYQGLTAALITWSPTLLPLIQQRLHVLMEKVGGRHWRIGGWLVLAVDGSRVTAPRTASNEAAFSAPNYGKSRSAKGRRKWKNKKRRSKPVAERVKPQQWLTLIWHVALCMPWTWKTGPSTSSERAHCVEMINTQDFPERTLFCMDAGFVGYDFWKSIQDAGHHFLVRVGANVTLLKKLGHVKESGGLVYLWPDKVAKKKELPLVLRLIMLQGPRGPVYLVTNVLSLRDLSDRLAGRLYRFRWGVELQFRSYKQTFGRGTLLSRTPQRATVELEWSLLGLWMIQLLAVKEQLAVGSPRASGFGMAHERDSKGAS